MWYQCSCILTRMTKQGMVSNGLPTFYLNGDMQGIMTAEHATRIAADIFLRFDLSGVEKLVINVSSQFDRDQHFITLDQETIADWKEQRKIP